LIKNSQNRLRIFIIAAVILLLYIVLLTRLVSIQLQDTNEYKESIATQSIRRIRIPAIRGRVFSSDGKILADNKVSYNVVFHLAEMRKAGRRHRSVDYIYSWAQKLAKALHRKLELTKKDIIRHMNMRPAMPITVFTDLNKRALAICTEYSPPILGMEIVALPQRFYPFHEVGCHFLGYTGKDDPGQASDRKDFNYYVPDVKGRNGIEKMIDKRIDLGVGYRGLRGKAGSKLLRVNVKGYVHDDLGVTIPPRNGNNVVLTIDWKAQEAAAKVLEGKTGSLILLDADTGAVLAMASSPGFDPNEFTGGISSSKWKKLLYDPKRPLFDRTLMGTYMPGSIIKPIVSLAALKAGINPYDSVYCDGLAKIGNSGIHCWIWRYGGHGYETMEDAIRDSCNVYFVETGLKLGLEKIAAMYKAAGLGKDTGIGLPERSGILPSVAQKKRVFGTPWRSFDTGLISIGQGILTVTPIQAVVYTAAIANGGTMWKPYIIKSITNYNNKLLYQSFPHKNGVLPVTQKDLNVVKSGMYKSVNDRANGGGSWRAKNKFITLSGKTGTAQVGTPPNRYKNTWFICFGTYHGRTYAMIISVEHGVAGGLTNAPMAKDFFELWLGDNRKNKINS
jgi:penicillin-binding protein 2